MHFPEEIWREIKRFIFKTKEMKKYESFIETFNYMNKITQDIIFGENNIYTYEDYLFQSWSFKKKILFIEGTLYTYNKIKDNIIY